MRFGECDPARRKEMATSLKLTVNGLTSGVSVDTPILYVLHKELHLQGPRLGCGLAQCGARLVSRGA
jgi:aerobic-type carbon monoxide dehydrogenase small subunit (CoxS/CutS family)